jgi:hypothetical protein
LLAGVATALARSSGDEAALALQRIVLEEAVEQLPGQFTGGPSTFT